MIDPHTTNTRKGSKATTTVDKIEAYRRVTMKESGAVWSDRTIYDSTLQPENRRERFLTYDIRPHKHVFVMWLIASFIVALFMVRGTGYEAFAIFAPAIQETFTHWGVK